MPGKRRHINRNSLENIEVNSDLLNKIYSL